MAQRNANFLFCYYSPSASSSPLTAVYRYLCLNTFSSFDIAHTHTLTLSQLETAIHKFANFTSNAPFSNPSPKATASENFTPLKAFALRPSLRHGFEFLISLPSYAKLCKLHWTFECTQALAHTQTCTHVSKWNGLAPAVLNSANTDHREFEYPTR